MQTNNNPLTEIGAIIIAVVLIAGGVVLLVLKDIDTAYATSIFILAGAIFAGNLALKAPSPTQQAALLNLTAQALQTQAQPAQLVQAPPQGGSVVAQPQVETTFTPNFTTSYNPPTGTMPQAIQTTGVIPAVAKPQTATNAQKEVRRTEDIHFHP